MFKELGIDADPGIALKGGDDLTKCQNVIGFPALRRPNRPFQAPVSQDQEMKTAR
jgi:hypothetical protein